MPSTGPKPASGATVAEVSKFAWRRTSGRRTGRSRSPTGRWPPRRRRAEEAAIRSGRLQDPLGVPTAADGGVDLKAARTRGEHRHDLLHQHRQVPFLRSSTAPSTYGSRADPGSACGALRSRGPARCSASAPARPSPRGSRPSGRAPRSPRGRATRRPRPRRPGPPTPGGRPARRPGPGGRARPRRRPAKTKREKARAPASGRWQRRALPPGPPSHSAGTDREAAVEPARDERAAVELRAETAPGRRAVPWRPPSAGTRR